MADHNAMELMICVAARFMEDGCSAVVGTGAPCAAAMLAQKTTAPNMLIMFEAGGVAPFAGFPADAVLRIAVTVTGRGEEITLVGYRTRYAPNAAG